jgi:hypothetical protein
VASRNSDFACPALEAESTMSDLHVAFVSKSFLRSHWDLEYRAWHDSENEKPWMIASPYGPSARI